MPITKDSNGVIQYTPASDRFETITTGVHPADSFAICDNIDQIRQIRFDPSSQATNSNVYIKTGNAVAGSDVIITLPSTSTTLSGAVEGFTIFQCDAGTSPTADAVSDTLTLTCTDSSLVITGNSTTDTVTFSAGSNLALLGGRSGGQTLKGDTASGGDLILMSTAHATKGDVTIGSAFRYDEVNNRVMVGDITVDPTSRLHFKGTAQTNAAGILLECDGALAGRFFRVLPQGNVLYFKNDSAGNYNMTFLSSGHTSICTTTDNAFVTMGGSIATVALATKTGAYTLTQDDYIVLGDATGGAFSLTLPTAAGFRGLTYVLKRISAANNVTVATTSSQTIDGAATYVLDAQYKSIVVVSDNSNWIITGVCP